MEEPRLTVVFRKEFDLDRYIAALYELARLKTAERANKLKAKDHHE